MVVTTTAAGQLEGVEIEGVEIFRGVPYAAAPVGPLRFRPPAPHPGWSGVRDATQFGSAGWQEPTPLEELNGTYRLTQDEDCLTLNVWTPSCDGGRRPVLVWIHGGSYLSGSGACEAYDGTSFAKNHGVVVVTINYRLNVFGYLHLESLSTDEIGSGSCGLLDQMAALTWVRDNIAAFGGDPGNVTVAGESAGAMSIGCLLGAPASYGLYHRAVLQSGSPSTQSIESASRVTTALLAELGIPADSAAPDALRAVAPDVLLKAAAGASTQRMLDEGEQAAAFSFAPVVGTSVVPRDPYLAVAEGAVRDVPLLIGTDLDELQVMELVMPGLIESGEAGLEAQLAAAFGGGADTAAEVYSRATAGSARSAAATFQADGMFLLPAIKLAEAQLHAGGDAWVYLFAWRTTAWEGRLGAFHTLEIPFVFNTLDRGTSPTITDGPPAQVRPLADVMHNAWASFARAGDAGWTRYDVSTRPTMVFDVDSRLVDDPLNERRSLWAAILG